MSDIRSENATAGSNQRKALVTGGAGFIGSHLAAKLLELGWEVHVTDNLTTGYAENVPPGAHFHELDVSKDGFTAQLPEIKFDAVFHLAAQSSGEVSFDDPMYDNKTNCLSTLMLLDWCHKRGIKRFIYTSSMSVYGDQKVQPVREDAFPVPMSFYGVGKLASEGYVNIYADLGMQTTSFRLFNVYGPGQNLANLRQGMVSIYLAYALNDNEILVKGSPDRYRDLVYIDDVISAYIAALDQPRTFGRTFNLASGVKTTVRELLNALLKALNYSESECPVKYGENTPGDIFGIYASIDELKDATGWEPKVSVEEGLKRMVTWAKGEVG